MRIDGDLESPGHASIFSIVLIKIIRNNFLDIFDFIFLRIAIEDIAKRRRILNYLSLVIQGKEKWSSSQLLLFHHRDENELVVCRIARLLQLQLNRKNQAVGVASQQQALISVERSPFFLQKVDQNIVMFHCKYLRHDCANILSNNVFLVIPENGQRQIAHQMNAS